MLPLFFNNDNKKHKFLVLVEKTHYNYKHWIHNGIKKMSKVINEVAKSIEKFANLDKGKWIVAYSGGVDSRLMLDVLTKIKPQGKEIIVIHVNHGLCQYATEWENKAIQTARSYDAKVYVENLNMTELSAIEEKARDLRYAAIQKYVEEGDLIFTGHHKNDNTETVLFRLFRGTGIAGLAGIPETRPFGKGNIVRPLLNLSRKEIEAYAQDNELLWVEDPSNKDSKYTRNFLRNEVIPLIESRWHKAIDSINALAKKAHESESLLNEIAEEDFNSIKDTYKDCASTPCINLDKLKSLSAGRMKNVLYYFINTYIGSVKSSKYFDNLLNVICSENKNNSKLRKVDFGSATIVTNGKKIWIINN